MIFPFDTEVALSVLRKYDSQCHNIIDQCSKVKIYNYDKGSSSWVIQDQSEGAFYLVKRLVLPLYKFVILSKYNKPGSFPLTTDIPISHHYACRAHEHFYMFKNESGVIQSIMFPTIEDCNRISKKVNLIINDLKIISDNLIVRKNATDDFPEANTIVSNDDKIFNLLESAKQRYNKSQSESEDTVKSIQDVRSRQININELFTSNNSIMTEKERYTSNKNQFTTHTNCNGNTTLTVSELEKLFSQCGTVNRSKVAYDEDDDEHLLSPQKLSTASVTNNSDVLSKEDLKDTLIYMLQNDDDGGVFLSRLHSAYVDLCQKKVARK